MIYMKKSLKKVGVLLLAFIVCMAAAGCTSDKTEVNINQTAENFVENEDFQYYLNQNSAFVKANNGYYFVADLKVHFYDTETNQAYPVCSKANCSHSDTKCQAFLSPKKFFPGLDIDYYNNSIYTFGYETDGTIQHNYLYQIDTDNFKQKKSAFLYDSGGGVSIVCMVHRGYVYYTHDGAVMKNTTASVYRTKLGDTGKNAPEKIYEFSGIGATVHNFSAFGNHLFFYTSSYEDESGNGYRYALKYINIHTLESKEITDVRYSYLADIGKIYYEENDKKVNCLDMRTGENTVFCNIDGPAYISANSNYIYFDNRQKMHIDESFDDRKISVYDKSGNFITEIIPKNPKDYCYFGGDDIMIFKEISTGEVMESDGVKSFYVLDKSQLLSPDKQFVDMKS